MAQSRIIGAVDIGTNKTVAVVGEVFENGAPEILGMGVSSVAGMRKGDILDLPGVGNSVHAALAAAEKKAKTQLSDVFLAYSGPDVCGMGSTGSVNVASADNKVTYEDMRRAAVDAKSKELPGGRLYINHAVNAYRLDGETLANPLGMQGRRLEVDYWHIYGEESKIRDRISILSAYNLKVTELIFSGIAAARMAATETERRMGVLVLDIGAGCTEYVLYRAGYPCFTGVVPVGGDHMTNDLAFGLRIGTLSADKLKITHASAALEHVGKDEKVWLLGDKNVGDRPVRREAIAQILMARVNELFEIIKADLGALADPEIIPGGVVLTGGSSRLDGIDLLAGRAFKVSARCAEPTAGVSEELAGPEFAAVLGVLKLGSMERGQTASTPKRGLLGKLATFFKSES